MRTLRHFASVTTLLAMTTGAAIVEARDRPGTPTDPRVTLVGPTEVDIHFRNTAGSELVVFELEMQVNGKRVDPNVERSISQRLGGMYGSGETRARITSKMLGGLLGPGIEFCFRAWSRTRVRDEGYLPTDNILSEIPSAWACAVPLPNEPPPPQEVSTVFKACALEVAEGRPCRPGFTDRTVLVRWMIPALPYGTTIDRVLIERYRYLPDAAPWEVDYTKEYEIRHALNHPVRQGEYVRAPKQPGAYQYRVCLENAAGRACGGASNTLTLENPQIRGTARTPGVVVPEQAMPRTAATVHELDNPNTRRAREIAATHTPPPPPPHVNPNGTTATASSSRVDPSGPVTLNPQPLPPKATRLRPRAPTVLTVPTQPTHHSGSSVSGGQIQGTARLPTAIETKGHLRLVCHGGELMLVKRRDSSAPVLPGNESANLPTFSVIFQVQLDLVPDARGQNVPEGYCGIVGAVWPPEFPPQVNFALDQRMVDRSQSPEDWLRDPNQFWTVAIERRSGSFDAIHPLEKIEGGTAKPEAGNVSDDVFAMDDRAIIIVGGKERKAGEIKREVRAELQASAGKPQVLKAAARKTATELPAASTLLSSSPPAAGSTRAGSVLQPQRATSLGRLAPKLESDCGRYGPRITQVRGTLSPGQTVTIEGWCFGSQPGTLELLGQFPEGAPQVGIREWRETGVVAVVPTINRASKHPSTITVIPAGTRQRSNARQMTFVPRYDRVEVPASLWSPNPNFEETSSKYSEVGLGHISGERLDTAIESGFAKEFRVGVNPACVLDSMEVIQKDGAVRGIYDWEKGADHERRPRISGARRCVKTIDKWVTGRSARVSCRIAFEVRAFAHCPSGIHVNP